MAICPACLGPLDPVVEALGKHPGCLSPEQVKADQLKIELTDVINWADANAARSLQTEPGPSELGTLCDRRLGYKLAGVPEAPGHRQMDAWPAIVGTAVHGWLQRAVDAFSEAHPGSPYRTETKVQVDDIISGSSDLYHDYMRMVVDYKTCGADMLNKLRRGESPPAGYQVQCHLYGLGYANQGLPVEHVALVFLPRGGWLKDMYVWVSRWEREIAEEALTRMYEVGQLLVNMEIEGEANPWHRLEGVPSKDCAWCPWFSPRPPEQGADVTGCPGSTGSSEKMVELAKRKIEDGIL